MARKGNRHVAELSKILTALCVRNTMLEDLHAGKGPITLTGDYSDVKVIDGTGQELAWSNISRLDDNEMKAFMKEVVSKLFTSLTLLDDPNFKPTLAFGQACCNKWDAPELLTVQFQPRRKRKAAHPTPQQK